GDSHHFLLHERKLIALGNDLAPFIDLLVNIDFDGTNIGAAAVEGGGKGEIAVFADVEGGIDDYADRPGIGCPVSEPSAAAIDRTGIHTGAAADAFERIPEILHAETFGAAVVDQHDVQFPAVSWSAEMRRVLRDRRAERAAREQANENPEMLGPGD